MKLYKLEEKGLEGYSLIVHYDKEETRLDFEFKPSNIKQCPFCSCNINVDYNDNADKYYLSGHKDNCCLQDVKIANKSLEDLISDWNKREET